MTPAQPYLPQAVRLAQGTFPAGTGERFPETGTSGPASRRRGCGTSPGRITKAVRNHWTPRRNPGLQAAPIAAIQQYRSGTELDSKLPDPAYPGRC